MTDLTLEQTIKISDISEAMKDMPAPKGFLVPDKDVGVRARFAEKISAIYLLMHWPFLNEEGPVQIDAEKGLSTSGLSLYAAVVKHGKKHVAELFFASEKNETYQGSVKVFAIEFPDNRYDASYDDWLMDELAKKTLGVIREKCLGHDI